MKSENSRKKLILQLVNKKNGNTFKARPLLSQTVGCIVSIWNSGQRRKAQHDCLRKKKPYECPQGKLCHSGGLSLIRRDM